MHNFEKHAQVVENHVYENKSSQINNLIFELQEQVYDETWYIELYCQLNEYEEYRSPLELWSVSPQLWRFLADEGELVTLIDNEFIWGRETSGQAIKLDYAITRYVEEYR